MALISIYIISIYITEYIIIIYIISYYLYYSIYIISIPIIILFHFFTWVHISSPESQMFISLQVRVGYAKL